MTEIRFNNLLERVNNVLPYSLQIMYDNSTLTLYSVSTDEYDMQILTRQLDYGTGSMEEFIPFLAGMLDRSRCGI
jgi:hypothetical protein